MHYYELRFNATDELLEDWCVDDDGTICQSFYIKVKKPLKSIKKTKEYLRKTFAPSDKYNSDLVNCLNPSTVDALAYYEEVDGAEFEMSCGIPA